MRLSKSSTWLRWFAAVAWLLLPAGCAALRPSWFPGATPEAASSDSAAQGSPGKTAAAQPPAANRKELGQYYADLAKGIDMEQGRKYPQARAQFERLIAEHPERYEAYQRLGRLCDRQKRFQEAQECYAKAIERQGKNPDADVYNDMGYSYFLQGKLDKAEAAISKAVAMRPKEPRYLNNLGLVYGHQRRFDQAQEEFRQAGGEAEACYNLAFVKASLNDMEGAKACFRRALSIDPKHEGARRALRAFEIAETDPDGLAQLEATADDGTHWVPYVESPTGVGPGTAGPSSAGGGRMDKSTAFVPPSRALSGSKKPVGGG